MTIVFKGYSSKYMQDVVTLFSKYRENLSLDSSSFKISGDIVLIHIISSKKDIMIIYYIIF